MEITASHFFHAFTVPKLRAQLHRSPVAPSSSSLRAGSNGRRSSSCCQLPTTSCSKPLTVKCTLSDETTLSSPPKVAAKDPTLALKTKAMDVAPDLRGTSIFLLGMKSSIKTQLAKLLAELLRYYYFDSDGLVEEAAGGEASAKLFQETDEQGFRESETEVLKQLSSMGRLVVCAGDGAVQSSTNLGLLRHGITIWIDVPLDIIAGEATKSDAESGKSHAEKLELTQLAAMYEKLRGGYATADVTISLQRIVSLAGYDDFDAVTAEDMAMEVLKEIEKLTRVKKMMEKAGRPF
ncbi:probable inactive shikimate kinase like 1, chloroplastic isoform X2 [Punica granatum]|uniref:Probable inactive shikimate kinase like 1, chloroplastic isoform X2 n=1 Tax=Punica granatum TaxID=22663 RepID=A0A6P8CPW3_PUNGR|nr:probable inactive shikimate kinase like 1, chloroplastic isoform X2 [Punica granatum]